VPNGLQYSRYLFLHLRNDMARMPAIVVVSNSVIAIVFVQPMTFGRKVTTIPGGQQGERFISLTVMAK
jgi:hypothetical protein